MVPYISAIWFFSFDNLSTFRSLFTAFGLNTFRAVIKMVELFAAPDLNIFTLCGEISRMLAPLLIRKIGTTCLISPKGRKIKKFLTEDLEVKMKMRFRDLAESPLNAALIEFRRALLLFDGIVSAEGTIEWSDELQGSEGKCSQIMAHINVASSKATDVFSNKHNCSDMVRLHALELVSLCATLEYIGDPEHQIAAWLLVISDLYSADQKLLEIIREQTKKRNSTDSPRRSIWHRLTAGFRCGENPGERERVFHEICDFLERFQEMIRAIHPSSEEMIPLIKAISFPPLLNPDSHGFVTQILERDGPSPFRTHRWFTELESELRQFYKENFEKFRPIPNFSLELSVDKNWVNLSLSKRQYSTQDYQLCIKKAFEGSHLVVADGKPGIGKTMLMKRVAFDWAVNRLEMENPYELVLVARLREVFAAQSVLDLVLGWIQRKVPHVNWETIKKRLSPECSHIMKSLKLLVILDGLDEWSGDCEELNEVLYKEDSVKLPFDLLITTRPHKVYNLRCSHELIRINGFSKVQTKKYVAKHFENDENSEETIKLVLKKLERNKRLFELAKLPLLLSFICIVHKRLEKGTKTELLDALCHWMVLRYEEKQLNKEEALNGMTTGNGINSDWQEAQATQTLANMAFEGILCKDGAPKLIFNQRDLTENEIEKVCYEVGFLSKTTDVDLNQSHQAIVSVEFPHASIQEFFAAMAIVRSLKDNHDVLLNQGLTALPDQCHLIKLYHHIQSRLSNWRQLIYTINFILGLTPSALTDATIKLTAELASSSLSSSNDSWRQIWPAAWPNSSFGNFFQDVDSESYVKLLANSKNLQLKEKFLRLAIQSLERADALRGIGQYIEFINQIKSLPMGIDLVVVADGILFERKTETLLCSAKLTKGFQLDPNVTIPQHIELLWCEGEMDFVQSCLEIFAGKCKRIRIAVFRKANRNNHEMNEWADNLQIEADWTEIRVMGCDVSWDESMHIWMKNLLARLNSQVVGFMGQGNAHFDGVGELFEVLSGRVSCLFLKYIALSEENIDQLIKSVDKMDNLRAFGMELCSVGSTDSYLKLLTKLQEKGVSELFISRQKSFMDLFDQICKVLKGWKNLHDLQLSGMALPQNFIQQIILVMENVDNLELLRLHNSLSHVSDGQLEKFTNPFTIVEL